ncbi:MAG: DNA polymerase III subunit, partial [Chloroflexi bacterium]|nr:DNA polymerase III subunit [Chloroflexota bacterium]
MCPSPEEWLAEWPLVGNRGPISLLRRSLLAGRLAQAYLVVGPPLVGKFSLALLLAQSLLCRETPRPCLACTVCRRVQRRAHPDVTLLGMAREEEDREREIGVDEVREMQRLVSLAPVEGTHRVVVVDGAERMTRSAANALLKTLEEPPANVVMLLLASDERQLLATVASRCQRITLRRCGRAEILGLLERVPDLTDERRQEILALADGRPGWAVAAAREGKLVEEFHRGVDRLLHLMGSDVPERLRAAETLAREYQESHQRMEAVFDTWRGWLRQALLSLALGTAWTAVRPFPEESRGQLGLVAASRLLRRLGDTWQQLGHNANARLAFDAL